MVSIPTLSIWTKLFHEFCSEAHRKLRMVEALSASMVIMVESWGRASWSKSWLTRSSLWIAISRLLSFPQAWAASILLSMMRAFSRVSLRDCVNAVSRFKRLTLAAVSSTWFCKACAFSWFLTISLAASFDRSMSSWSCFACDIHSSTSDALSWLRALISFYVVVLSVMYC